LQAPVPQPAIVLYPRQTQQFTSGRLVDWSVSGPGLIESSGLFTAPSTVAAGSAISGCPIFPNNNIWNVLVDTLPIDLNSFNYISAIGASGSLSLQGSDMAYNLVRGTTPKVRVDFTGGYDSDAGPYAIPKTVVWQGTVDGPIDHYLITLDYDNCVLYELYNAYVRSDGSYKATSGRIFDLKTNRLNPDGVDAAGMPIFPARGYERKHYAPAAF